VQRELYEDAEPPSGGFIFCKTAEVSLQEPGGLRNLRVLANTIVFFYLIRMPEYKASLVCNEYYHIFNRAVGNEKIFIIEENYRYFLQLFEKYIVPLADTLCYCLLPNHFHFFICTKEQEVINKRMEHLQYRHAGSENQSPKFILQQFGNFFNALYKSIEPSTKQEREVIYRTFQQKNRFDYRVLHKTHSLHSCKSGSPWPLR
jgi:putative transposase